MDVKRPPWMGGLSGFGGESLRRPDCEGYMPSAQR